MFANTCHVLSRRLAAIMSTIWRKNYSFKRIFEARREGDKRHNIAVLFRPLNLSSGHTNFRVADCREGKRTLLGASTKVSALSCVAAENCGLYSGSGIGIGG